MLKKHSRVGKIRFVSIGQPIDVPCLECEIDDKLYRTLSEDQWASVSAIVDIADSFTEELYPFSYHIIREDNTTFGSVLRANIEAHEAIESILAKWQKARA